MVYENVRKLCEERGISIRTLELACGISNGTIGKWRESIPRTDVLMRVADYFGVTVESLMKK